MSYGNMFGNQPKTLVAIEPKGTTGLVFPGQNNGVEQAGVTNWTHVVGKPEVTNKLIKAQSTSDEFAISEFGTEAGKKVAALADTILKKTTTGKMSDFGDGLTQILTLTGQVNVDDLNIDKSKGIVGKVTGFFKKKKVEVMAQFEDTSKSIDKVVADLRSRQGVMRDDNAFLKKLYDENLSEYHDLGHSVEAIDLLLKDLNHKYEMAKAQASTSSDHFFIQSVNEQEQVIKRWEKQMDRLKRMQQVALLTAPEIRMIQAGNVTMVEKFEDTVNTTIPAWKKQLSMTILALRQKENAELGNAIDDQTNNFFRKAAELNHSNAIAVAQAGERSVVDIETLEFMQQQLIDSVKQVKQIQETGREERRQASVKIDSLRDQMKQEMLTWS